jgi:hypothetical protein
MRLHKKGYLTKIENIKNEFMLVSEKHEDQYLSNTFLKK